VVAYFEGDSRGFISLAFENIGNSPAYNVRFHFHPDPINYNGQRLGSLSVFAYPISFLPQGKRHRQIINRGNVMLAGDEPTKYSITTSYESPEGEKYEDARDHDIAFMKEEITPPKTIEDLVWELNLTLGHIRTKT
jgi:hypothetical protein